MPTTRIRRLLHATLTLAFTVAAPVICHGEGMNPQAPSEAMSIDERRSIEIKGHLLALKGAIDVRADQAGVWEAFEAAVNQVDGETRTFVQAYCTLSGIRNQAVNPAVAAHRSTALGQLMIERGHALERLAAATASLHDSLAADQARRYDVMASQLFRTVITPPYSSPQSGLPAICADTPQGGLGRPPIIMPGPNMIRPVPRPQNSGPKAFPL